MKRRTIHPKRLARIGDAATLPPTLASAKPNGSVPSVMQVVSPAAIVNRAANPAPAIPPGVVVPPTGTMPAKILEAVPDLLRLTVQLVGRICLVEHDGDFWALLLDAERNKDLGFRRHRPLLRARLDDAKQSGADQAFATFCGDDGHASALWDVAGYDMAFEGLLRSTIKPRTRLDALADVQAAFARVDDKAEWLSAADLLFGDNPKKHGVLARLSLKGFETIDTMFFERNGALLGSDVQSKFAEERQRIYLPGHHQQETHAIVRCTALFRALEEGTPTLVLRSFDAGTTRRIAFDDDGAEPVLTLSNLCTCVGDPHPEKVTLDGEELVKEDDEFALYYELLKQPPLKDRRPVPFISEKAGAVAVPECVPTGFMRAR